MSGKHLIRKLDRLAGRRTVRAVIDGMALDEKRHLLARIEEMGIGDNAADRIEDLMTADEMEAIVGEVRAEMRATA